MTRTTKLAIFFLLNTVLAVEALNCNEIFLYTDITFISWTNLQPCLKEVNNGVLHSNTTTNIWRLIKTSFGGIENIKIEAFQHLGYILTAIPVEELRNLSMERTEIVEAFGVIRGSDDVQGFSAEQNSLIAQKVRNEWLGKNPETYSEYDLISMGEILCQFNVDDIKGIHPDAFKNSAEWIGKIKNCPQDRLQAFAQLAKHPDAFGAPSKWSKLDVSLVGKILNGLSQSDIILIDKDKLHLNRYYSKWKTSKNTADDFHNNKTKHTDFGNN